MTADLKTPAEKLDGILWEAIDYAAAHPAEARDVDPRTWQHLLTYSTYTPSPAEGDENPWKAAIDEALVVNCLDCIRPDETAEQALARLIAWEVETALDPAVSERAAALQSQAQPKHTEAPAVDGNVSRAAESWRALTETMIDAYLEDYEMVGEDEGGRDACYAPTEGERALIKDAIMGLLAEADSVGYMMAGASQAPAPVAGDRHD